MAKNILSKEEMEKRAKIKEYGFILLPVNTEIWEDFTPEQTGMLLSAVSDELLDIGFPVDIPPELEKFYQWLIRTVVNAPYDEYADI